MAEYLKAVHIYKRGILQSHMSRGMLYKVFHNLWLDGLHISQQETSPVQLLQRAALA